MKQFEKILKTKFLRTKFAVIVGNYFDENNKQNKYVRIKWEGKIPVKNVANFIEEKKQLKTINLFKRFYLFRCDFETNEQEFLTINI